jgi:hypothetical protein
VLQLAERIIKENSRLKENSRCARLRAGRIAFLLTPRLADEKSPVVSENPVKYRVEVVAAINVDAM